MEALEKSILFKGLRSQELLEILELDYFRILKLDRDSYVFQQGQVPGEMFILLEGSVQVEKIDVNGKRVIVNIFNRPGTVFGEVYLYLSDHPYDYGCLAREDSRVLAIDREFFSQDNDLQKRLTRNMLEILASKAFHLNQKLLIMGSFSLRQKIANYLLQKWEESPEIKLNFKREELADYLGTTRPSLSRELSRMEDQGLISLGRNTISISNIEDLKLLV